MSRFFALLPLLVLGAHAFLDDLEEVTTPGTGPLKAVDRCGEGATKGKKKCVSIYDCDPNTNTVRPPEQDNTRNVDGYGIIDIRFGANSCEHYLDVCCNLAPGGEEPSPNTPKPSTQQPPVDNGPSYCGMRNENGISFQIKGNTHGEAEFAEFPWMVAVMSTVPRKDGSYVCGGSLITPQVVLTAAHCVRQFSDPGQIKIRAGDWDTQTVNEPLPYQEVQVSRIIIHEEFNDAALHNDVALLVLSGYVAKAKNVGTVCLPPQGALFDSRDCFATGWGKTNFESRSQQQVILKKLQLPMVQREQCVDDLRKTRLSQYFELHPSFICAGGEKDLDTCTGDGGGPLVCPDPTNPQRYMQVGIVSWGINCGLKNVPGVYADVAQFRNWIDGEMARLNLNTDPYNL